MQFREPWFDGEGGGLKIVEEFLLKIPCRPIR
jgi:hypothetical protein